MFDERMGAACAKTIGALVDDQRRYHAATVTGLETVERRLERIGDTLFVLTLAVAVAYLAGVAWGVSAPPSLSYVVTGLTAGLPAFGAAAYGLRLIGDFAGTASRSRRTRDTLRAVGDAARGGPRSLPALRSLARTAADAMLGDVSRWRLATETRKLAIPG